LHLSGLIFAEGDDHRRQRKIMNPSFTTARIRSLMPVFYSKAQIVRDVWLDAIPLTLGSEKAGKPKAVVNILDTFMRMTLDIVGLTGFDYPFDGLHNIGDGGEGEYGNELAQAYATILNHAEAYNWKNIIMNWFPILIKIFVSSLHLARSC
jgi:cytochrome P450